MTRGVYPPAAAAGSGLTGLADRAAGFRRVWESLELSAAIDLEAVGTGSEDRC
jgi:hypothetical protein